MTQEDKDLLFKDLCARLPYGVKFPTKICCEATHDIIDVVRTIQSINSNGICRTEEGDDCDFPCAWSVRPYLFPMSSMTEKQKEEIDAYYRAIFYGDTNKFINQYIDWLNKNHFDYRGLIPKGLANDATGLNIY